MKILLKINKKELVDEDSTSVINLDAINRSNLLIILLKLYENNIKTDDNKKIDENFIFKSINFIKNELRVLKMFLYSIRKMLKIIVICVVVDKI